MSIVVDALKNVVRTFLSLLVVGVIIYGGIYLINESRKEEVVIVDNDPIENEDSEEPNENEPPLEYETITYKDPVRSDLRDNSFSRTGIVTLSDQVEVGSDLSSTVEEILVEAGSEVKKGDVLFKLAENTATKQLAINLDSAEKQLANAYRSLDLTRQNAGISENSYRIQLATADIALEQAVLSLNSSRDLAARQLGVEDMGKEVEEIGNEISANTPSLEKTIGNIVNENLGEFLGGDLENQYDFESAQEDLEEAQGNLEYGQRQLQAAQNYYTDVRNIQQIENARLQIESLRNQIASQRVATDLNINQLMSQINQAEAQVALAKVQLDQTVVTAPVDGTVLDIDLNVGQKTTPGMNYILISSEMNKQIEVFVSLEQASLLQKGDEIEVVYAGEKYDGEVKNVALIADERSRLIKVKIGNLSDNGNLIANAFAKVNFKIEKGGSDIIAATVVPFRSLKIDNNEYFAAVKSGNEILYKQVDVKGPIQAGKIQVVGGLQEGDEIVLEEASKLISFK